jgi:hypothetical protein
VFTILLTLESNVVFYKVLSDSLDFRLVDSAPFLASFGVLGCFTTSVGILYRARGVFYGSASDLRTLSN